MKLSFLFTHHMVLQRNKPIRIWGEGCGEITVSLNGSSVTVPSESGKWLATLPEMEAGGPYTLTVCGEGETVTLTDVLVGEVWIAAGQSNMEHPTMAAENGLELAKSAENPNLRLFHVPRHYIPGVDHCSWYFEPALQTDRPWMLCSEETALHFSAIGWGFGRRLQEFLQVPVGIICCNHGATNVETWIPQEVIDTHPALAYARQSQKDTLEKLDLDAYDKEFRYRAYLQDIRLSCLDAMKAARELTTWEYNRYMGLQPLGPNMPLGPYHYQWPGLLYETMVSRIVPFAARGVLWYQGESNAADNLIRRNYRDIFAVMVDCWRNAFREELPFLTVQLAPFGGEWLAKDCWIPLIQQQIEATQTIDKVYMVTSTELGEEENIHPLRKDDFAGLLFKAAKTHTYGQPEPYSGPVFRCIEKTPEGYAVFFDRAEGGLVCDGPVAELQVLAGGVWQDVSAQLRGNALIIPTPEGAEQLRLGKENFFRLNLKNTTGYLAAPFWVSLS